MNSPARLKNPSARVPWWNKELAKLRVEVRRLFNRARNSSKGDWERFREAQHAYKKAIKGEKKIVVESSVNASRRFQRL